MRIRYQMYKSADQVICDLPDKKARRMFADLSKDGKCLWAELVGEEEENYMDILESFDHWDEVWTVCSVFEEIFG